MSNAKVAKKLQRMTNSAVKRAKFGCEMMVSEGRIVTCGSGTATALLGGETGGDATPTVALVKGDGMAATGAAATIFKSVLAVSGSSIPSGPGPRR